jgi:hypothetical protein
MPDEQKIEEKKSDVEILFPDQEVYGVKVRPWTFSQFVSILPDLLGIRKNLKENGIEIGELENLREDDEGKILDFLVKLLPMIPATTIVAKTIKEDVNKIEEWEFDKTAGIFLVILIQNAGRIKNFFGLGLKAMREVRKAG